MYTQITAWAFYCCVLFACSPTSKSTLAGAQQETIVEHQSKIVEARVKGRQLSIYLPANYSKDHSYKVIYFHDGQHLFSQEWNLQPLLDKLIKEQKIAPILLVGIHSTADRSSDLVPYQDNWIIRNWGDYTPRAPSFSTFIKKEIRPVIAQKYSISEDKSDHALFGASFGGLHAIWDAAEHPEDWGMVAGISPSAWVADYALFKTVEKAQWEQTKVWMDIGTGEWEYYIPMVDQLIEKGLEYGRDLFYYEVPNAQHNAQDWRKRIAYPIQVFAGQQEHIPVSMKVEVEFIPSQSTDRVFKRVNPIITCSNGVRFSASAQATYTLINSEAGTMQDDGRFEFKKKEDLKVRVRYKNFEESLTIKFREK